MNATNLDTKPSWLSQVKGFEGADDRKAIVQLVDTLLPYLALYALMLVLLHLGAPIWLPLLLALPGGAFLVRTFILFHDCCHGSFLSSRRANDALGIVLGILALTPFADWRRSHGIHHSSAGNLDRRGLGDIWTMTVAEYAASPPLRRLLYRFYRNPITLFIFGPFFIFVLLNRFPSKGAKKRQIRDLVLHNAALIAMGAALSIAFGPLDWLLVQGSIIFFGGIAGIWMFYVQHQFDPTYWARDDRWSSFDAALQGSSWYRLPRIAQWITGNIGLHHIHHLNPRIPNYRLQACLDAIPELVLPGSMNFARSLKSIGLNLWDEKGGILVSFRRSHALIAPA